MPDPRPELSSVATTLSELTERLAVIAEQNAVDHDDNLAIELFEVERTLAGAHRRLVRLLDTQRR
ncbi:MAG: hypothetical protein ACR2H3_09125 [Acidimicrobiales bacterium]